MDIWQQEQGHSKNQYCGSGFIESGSGYGSGSSISSEYGSGYGSSVWCPKIGKKYSWNWFLFFFWLLIAVYLSLGLSKGRSSYKRSLQPSKKNIQHFKRWNLLTVFYFSGPFLLSWIRILIANPDTDPGTPLNPDPQHWYRYERYNAMSWVAEFTLEQKSKLILEKNHQLSVFGEVRYRTCRSGNSVCCRIQTVMESTIIILFY